MAMAVASSWFSAAATSSSGWSTSNRRLFSSRRPTCAISLSKSSFGDHNSKKYSRDHQEIIFANADARDSRNQAGRTPSAGFNSIGSQKKGSKDFIAESKEQKVDTSNLQDAAFLNAVVEQHQEATVIIIGAGTTGLATAAYLHHLSIPYMIIEREDCFASLWKKYCYDRVRLHLAKEFNQLPMMPFPETYPTYVSRKEFLSYLNDYVSMFEIRPVYRQVVEAAWFEEGKWKVKTRETDGDQIVREYRTRFLVVATGETCDPWIPRIEGLERFGGEYLHSTKYKNGERFKGKSVLVVGGGNSGMEIALDLASYGVNTSIVVRGPVNVLSRQILYAGVVLVNYLSVDWVDRIMSGMSRVLYGDLTKYGIRRPKEGPFSMKAKYGKFPVVDAGTVQKIKSGKIQVLPGIKSVSSDSVEFENGKVYPFDAIVFATGFKRSTNQWLKGDDYLLNEDGLPKPSYPDHWKGKKGLYCAGLSGRGFYGAASDAQKIAHDIKASL